MENKSNTTYELFNNPEEKYDDTIQHRDSRAGLRQPFAGRTLPRYGQFGRACARIKTAHQRRHLPVLWRKRVRVVWRSWHDDTPVIPPLSFIQRVEGVIAFGIVGSIFGISLFDAGAIKTGFAILKRKIAR